MEVQVFMSQSRICKNFALYFEHTYPKLNPKLHSEAEIQEAIDEDDDLFETKKMIDALRKGGYCFGFMNMRALMGLLGKKRQWYVSLRLAANWDGDPKKLKKRIRLPKASRNDPKTLGALLKRTAQLIAAAQCVLAKAHKNLFVEGINQRNFLNPNTPLFDHLCKILGCGDKIKPIKSLITIGGTFNVSELALILDEDLLPYLEDGIATIHSGTHGMYFEDGIVYNSNYRHRKYDKKHKIEKHFEDRQKFVEQIYKDLKVRSIGIVIGSFKEYKKVHLPNYEKILANKTDNIVAELGFSVIASFAKDKARSVLKKVGPKGVDNIVKGLTIVRKGWIAIHLIIIDMPDIMAPLMKLLGDKIRKVMMQTLTYQHPTDGDTTLQLILQSTPHLYPQVLFLLGTEGRVVLVQALIMKNEDEVTGWKTLFDSAQASIPQTLRLIGEDGIGLLADIFVTDFDLLSELHGLVVNQQASSKEILFLYAKVCEKICLSDVQAQIGVVYRWLIEDDYLRETGCHRFFKPSESKSILSWTKEIYRESRRKKQFQSLPALHEMDFDSLSAETMSPCVSPTPSVTEQSNTASYSGTLFTSVSTDETEVTSNYTDYTSSLSY